MGKVFMVTSCQGDDMYGEYENYGTKIIGVYSSADRAKNALKANVDSITDVKNPVYDWEGFDDYLSGKCSVEMNGDDRYNFITEWTCIWSIIELEVDSDLEEVWV